MKYYRVCKVTRKTSPNKAGLAESANPVLTLAYTLVSSPSYLQVEGLTWVRLQDVRSRTTPWSIWLRYNFLFWFVNNLDFVIVSDLPS